MFCSGCGKAAGEDSKFCASCGAMLGSQSKPSASPSAKYRVGIIVTSVLSSLSLIWSLLVVFGQFLVQPSQSVQLMRNVFPSIQTYTLLGSSASILGNCALLIGAWLTYSMEERGLKIIRLTPKLMMFAGCLLTFLSLDDMTSNMNWDRLDAATKGGIVGGAIGAAIGGLIQYGLILFLFRERKELDIGNPAK